MRLAAVLFDVVREGVQRLLAFCVGVLGQLTRKLPVDALWAAGLADSLAIRIHSGDVLLLQSLTVFAFEQNPTPPRGRP